MASITEDTTPESLFSNWAEISNMFPMIYGEDRKKRENKKYALNSRLKKKQYKSDLLMYYRGFSHMVDRETLCNAEIQRLRNELETFKNGSHASTMIDTSPVLMLEDKRAEPKHSVQLTTEYIELVEKEQEILKQNIRPDQKSFFEFYMNIYETRDTLEVKKFKKYTRLMKEKIEELKENKALSEMCSEGSPFHRPNPYEQLYDPSSDIPLENNNNREYVDYEPDTPIGNNGADTPIGNNVAVEDMDPESSDDGSKFSDGSSSDDSSSDEEEIVGKGKIYCKFSQSGYTDLYGEIVKDNPKMYSIRQVDFNLNAIKASVFIYDGKIAKVYKRFVQIIDYSEIIYQPA